MKSALLNIGNELLSGATVNTNAAWLGRTLLSIGHPVSQTLVVSDSRDAILDALTHLWEYHDIIIVTGGLGPTHDDITVSVVAEFFGSELEFHQITFDALEKRLSERGIEVTERHRQQATLPIEAKVILNQAGTASALHFDRDNKHLFCLPGVPHEMRHLMSNKILPFLENLSSEHYKTQLFRTIGLPESRLYEDVKDIIEPLQEGAVAFLPQIYGVDLRLIEKNDNLEQGFLLEISEQIRKRVGENIYAEEDIPLAQVIGNMLRERDMTLATAESCTGGLLADMITDILGSSDYFLEGFVTYSNTAKMRDLGVPEELIQHHGAVSEPVAKHMALGAKNATGADAALSTTGIAGPTGGTAEKPVGLVYIGCAVDDNVTVKRYRFSDERRLNKQRSVYAALNLLRGQMQKI
ncbi:MAG: competence/damage-inducible protein A [Candidatus Marinimicrobia bacterium]|nr:competence/damage-inducible protein A [Candidatus Neomarinimicrobiota bacterium]MCF7828076.1 competence/damage-inducible protein A [Candidatus Neomarinimicrobiota bacterium]MCF7879749.1 competence/damage-inducible protein A [Candidatus Neomarinimicrobiota bacterium]